MLVQEYTARKAIKAGLPNGPFKGVPFLIKDLGAEAIDFPTHSGSNLLRDTTYSFESEIYRRIRRTGMVTFGRTTSPEGGIGPVTESAVYDGPTRNPWDTSRTAGGSSGGSGAAVAAGIVPMAHGSDGGGSVRIPASSCGLFGFKATRARFPDGPASGEGWGGMAIDGFLSKSVRDNARMMDACTGPDKGADYVNAINTFMLTDAKWKEYLIIVISYSQQLYQNHQQKWAVLTTIVKTMKIIVLGQVAFLNIHLSVRLLMLVGNLLPQFQCIGLQMDFQLGCTLHPPLERMQR